MYCNMLKYNCTACNYLSTYYSTGGTLRLHLYSLTCFLYHWSCNYLDFESPLLHHVQCSLIIACTHTLCTCNYQHVHTHARYSTGASRLHKYTGRRRSLSVALCLNLIILAIFFIFIPQTIITITILIFITDAIMSLPLTMAMTGIT